jgi:hypothetical protein
LVVRQPCPRAAEEGLDDARLLQAFARVSELARTGETLLDTSLISELRRPLPCSMA